MKDFEGKIIQTLEQENAVLKSQVCNLGHKLCMVRNDALEDAAILAEEVQELELAKAIRELKTK
jgi:hypothetical protein